MRKLQEKDRESILSYLQNEPELWLYSPTPVKTIADQTTYFENALKSSETSYSFVIEWIETGKIIGSTRFYDMNFTQKTTRIGYSWLSSSFQGTGVNQQTKHLLFDYIFEHLHFERAEFCVDERNSRSRFALLKLGCVQEGILRNHQFVHDGSRRNTVVFSFLKEEWKTK